jgi:large subunit ribosomal protein L3
MTKRETFHKSGFRSLKKSGTVAKKKSLNSKFCNRTKLDLIDVSMFVEGEFVDVQGVSQRFSGL